MNLNELRHWLLDGLGTKVSFVEPMFMAKALASRRGTSNSRVVILCEMCETDDDQGDV